MPIDKMLEKAYDLVHRRRVEHIGEGMYNVIGNHGTYTVAQKFNGTVNCSCPGFVSRGRCSHSLAVLMLIKPSLMKSVGRMRKTYNRSGSASSND